MVFTASVKKYAEFVLEKIDPNHVFIEQLFWRTHCKQIGKFHVKDLNLILDTSVNNLRINPLAEDDSEAQKCDLNKTIIIDNLQESFKF